MGPASGNGWGVLILFVMCTGRARGDAMTAERVPSRRGLCVVELQCSAHGDLHQGPSYEWFRGSEILRGDTFHKVTFGSKMLTVSLDADSGATVYKCRNSQSKEDMFFDVRHTCGFSESVVVRADRPLDGYLNAKCILTGLFLAICFTALTITFCCLRQETSKEKLRRQGNGRKGHQEEIYSALEEAAGPSVSPQPSAAQEDYTALENGASDTDYHALSPNTSPAGAPITYSAEEQEVTIELAP